MEKFELQEEDAPELVVWYIPMGWLRQIRPHRSDQVWSASLCQTFFAACVGANTLALSELPLSGCGCKKFQIDAFGDHLCPCTAHSGAKKAHDWAFDQIAGLFRTTHKAKTQQCSNPPRNPV
jgi:hypothetical protein